MPKYNKQSLDSKTLLKEFQSYGLIIGNEQEALNHIQNVGAHRLSQYFLPFYISKRQFIQKTNFNSIIKLYMMDRDLRFLCLDAIERIEVAFRAIFFNTMSERYNPHWYLDPLLFTKTFDHGDFVHELKTLISFHDPKKQCEEVKEYLTHYNNPILPTSWVVAEKIPFGTLLYLYNRINDSNDRQAIAIKLGFKATFFTSYLKYIKHFRNKCAHHERIWDVSHHIDMPKIERYLLTSIPLNNTKCYTNLAVLNLIRKSITNNKYYSVNLKRILKDAPLPYHIPMGFPANWLELPFWNE